MSKRLTTGVSLVLSLVSILPIGCGKSKSKGKNTATPQTYFVFGDPLVMLDGTDQDTTSFFTQANLNQFEDYTLAGFTVFAPKVDTSEIDTVTSQKELEDQNSTSGDELENDLSLYSFQSNGSQATYRADATEFPEYPVLEFTAIDGRWNISSIDGEAVTAEHYGISSDQRVFSVLVSATDELGNFLAALTFTRVDGAQAPMPDQNNDYPYIAGNGIAIPWSSPVKVSICGNLSAADQATFKQSVTDWSTAAGQAEGTLGGLSYELEVVTAGKPFNDVNQHCIQLVKNYRLEEQEDLAVFGVTMPVVDFQTFKIVDSHIFIFYDALARFREPYLLTATHEMGHFWGLGHEFTRSASGQILHPSIMGYSGVETITDWDVAAIKSLYP